MLWVLGRGTSMEILFNPSFRARQTVIGTGGTGGEHFLGLATECFSQGKFQLPYLVAVIGLPAEVFTLDVELLRTGGTEINEPLNRNWEFPQRDAGQFITEAAVAPESGADLTLTIFALHNA